MLASPPIAVSVVSFSRRVSREVGVGLEVAGGGFGREAVEGGESWLVEIDGAGGAGDVFEVGAKGVEQGLVRADASKNLGGAGGCCDPMKR